MAEEPVEVQRHGEIEAIGREAREAPIGGRWAQVAAAVSTGLLVIAAFPMGLGSHEMPDQLTGLSAWVAFAPLLLVAHGRPPKRVASLFGLAAFVYFTGTLSWLVVPMTDFGGIPFPVAVFAMSLLTAFLALFHAGAGWLAARIAARRRIGLVWPAALALTSIELVRNYIFTGFPWANVAYSQARFEHLIQIADFTGIYGLTFLIVAFGGAVAGLARWVMRGDTRGWRHFGVAVGLLALTWGYGSWRLPRVLAAEAGATPLRVGVLQGNIPMDFAWQEANGSKVTSIYAEQVRLALGKSAELIVWPEAAYGLVPVDARGRGEMPTVAFPDGQPGVPQIIGAVTYLPFREGERPLMYNSAVLVDPDRKIVDRYSKSHLVPFGEYLPLPWLLSYLGPLLEAVGAFEQGEAAATVTDGRHRYGVLVCYESIFPEIARAMAKNGAQMLIVITNDTWFGRNMPRQHLDMAVFRAVETRRPVARAANTGISAFISAGGQVLERTGLYVPAVVVRELRLDGMGSPYLVIGDAFAWLCVLATGALAFLKTRNADPG